MSVQQSLYWLQLASHWHLAPLVYLPHLPLQLVALVPPELEPLPELEPPELEPPELEPPLHSLV